MEPIAVGVATRQSTSCACFVVEAGYLDAFAMAVAGVEDVVAVGLDAVGIGGTGVVGGGYVGGIGG